VAPQNAPELSVVVPAHNEAENIVPLLGEIAAALSGVATWEVVVVDDRSGDDTLQRLRAAAGRFPWLRIVTHARNCGQSAAIHSGVRFARSPLVATLDGDGQNDPADIPKLLAAWRERAGAAAPVLVAGQRLARRDTFVTRASSRIANAVRGRLLGDRTRDTGCGLKLFEREAFLALPAFDHMHRFLPALFLRAGGSVLPVGVGHRPRTRGRSHYGIGNRLWVGIVDLVGVWWLMRRVKSPGAVESRG